jgi:hypothetical protein
LLEILKIANDTAAPAAVNFMPHAPCSDLTASVPPTSIPSTVHTIVLYKAHVIKVAAASVALERCRF